MRYVIIFFLLSNVIAMKMYLHRALSGVTKYGVTPGRMCHPSPRTVYAIL